MPRRRNKRLAGIVILLLGGCAMGPDFHGADSWSPENWFDTKPAPVAATSVVVAEPIKPDWWNELGDPELTALENRVATANFDVRAATIRLAESREQRRITAADEFPQLRGDASYTRQKPSPDGVFSLLGGSGGGASAGAGTQGIPSQKSLAPFNLWQYGFDASWELDLWGKVRRSVEAADATIESSDQARRDTLLSTMAEVARNYVQLRGTQTQLQIAKDNRDAAQEIVRLTHNQAANGTTSQIDVTSATAQLLSAAAAIPTLEQQEAQAINGLGFLLGEPPRALEAELSTARPVPPVPPRVPIGLPSELAKRRPDIREAEAKLHAQTAQIGVAEANFYPSITLSGNFDIQALKFSDLGNWGAHTYGFGPSVSIPIFEGGKLAGNLALSKAEQQEAALEYQRTVLNAWQEVDNALVAYAQEQQRNGSLHQQVEQAAEALRLAREQYDGGLTDYLHVLDAQRQWLSAQQQAADSTVLVSTNFVSLYKALGGGWDETGQ